MVAPAIALAMVCASVIPGGIHAKNLHCRSDHHASEGIGKRRPRALVLVLEEHVGGRRSSAPAAARPSRRARPRRSPGGAGAGSPSPRSPRTASRTPPNRRCTTRRSWRLSTAYTSSANHDSCRNSTAARRPAGSVARNASRRPRSLRSIGGSWNRIGPRRSPSAPHPVSQLRDPVARAGQPPHVRDAARALEREAERPGRRGRPALEQRRVRASGRRCC